MPTERQLSAVPHSHAAAQKADTRKASSTVEVRMIHDRLKQAHCLRS